MWGTGSALREFLYIDDVADGTLFIMQNYSGDPNPTAGVPGCYWINLGCGSDITMKELGHIISDVVGFKGRITFDHIHPDGTPRKLLDCSKLKSIGWKPKYSFIEGLKKTYEDYLVNKDNYRS